MRNQIAVALAASVALGLAACSSAEEVGETLGTETASEPQASAQASAEAGSAKAVARSDGKAVAVSEDTDDFSFAYSYPAAAAAIPALRQRFEDDREARRNELTGQVKEGKADAAQGGYEYHTYGFSKSWDVVADLPRFLSLSNGFDGYTGGAHGYYGSGSLVWDREADALLEPVQMFTSAAALEEALGKRYCAALNRERKKRREGYGGGTGMFEECVAIADVTVLLGSSDKAHFDRIGLIADPYVAGPYVEGSYEVTLPVDKALIAAVKPEYRAAFSVKR